MILSSRPILIAIFCLLFATAANAQSRCTVPAGFMCITQAEANVAASHAHELAALRSEIDTLKAQLIEKDKIREADGVTARQNLADVTAALHDTESKLSFASGQVTECKADKVMYTSLIEFLTKNQKSKQNGLFNVKLGGN